MGYQPPVNNSTLSENGVAINNQSTVLFSQNKSTPAIRHRPNEEAE
jgi:hypothetical protein